MRGTVYGCRGGNLVGSVGLVLWGHGPCASGQKLSRMNASGRWICIGAGGWGGRRRFAIMPLSDVCGLRGVGTVISGISPLILFHLSLRCLIAIEVSDLESNSDSCLGVSALAHLCSSANLLIKSSSHCSLFTSSVLSCGRQHWRSSSKNWFVNAWLLHRSSVWALMASKTSQMWFRASQSMLGASGLTVALETTDGVGDTDIGKTC